jgi:hypothetical protein
MSYEGLASGQVERLCDDLVRVVFRMTAQDVASRINLIDAMKIVCRLLVEGDDDFLIQGVRALIKFDEVASAVAGMAEVSCEAETVLKEKLPPLEQEKRESYELPPPQKIVNHSDFYF